MIIAIVNDIHTRFPAVSTRQWNFWVSNCTVPSYPGIVIGNLTSLQYHVFGSALCLGTLVLRDPSNPMGTFVLSQIDAAINLFTSLIRNGANTPRYNRNLQWLMKLRARASSKISKASTPQQYTNSNNPQRDDDHDPHHDHNPDRHRSREEREESEDVELLGWRTRLIERAGQNHQTIRTIHLAPTPNGSHITSIPNPSPGGTRVEGSHGNAGAAGGDFRSPDLTMPSSSFPWMTPDSTDGFVSLLPVISWGIGRNLY